jgi:hypothetical protein
VIDRVRHIVSVNIDRRLFVCGDQQGQQIPPCIGCGGEPTERLLGGAFVCTRCRDMALRYCQLFDFDLSNCLQRDHVRCCAAFLAIGEAHVNPGYQQEYLDRVRSIEAAGGPRWL